MLGRKCSELDLPASRHSGTLSRHLICFPWRPAGPLLPADTGQLPWLSTHVIDTKSGCDNRDRSELQNDKEYNDMTAKLVKQKTESPNQLLLKAVRAKENVIYFLHNIATFPFTIYHLYRQYQQEIDGPYIQITQ